MRTIVITGASDGIGAAAAEQLAEPQTRLVIVGRSPAKTQAVAERTGAEYHIADFTRLDEVRALAETLLARHDRIEVLANNAGGLFSGPELTADGFEKTFQVNHLAPFLLTHLLTDRLLSSRATVVATSSIASLIYSRLDLADIQTMHPYRPNRAYGNAKLANILFTKGLHARFGQQGLSAVAFHPGAVATNFASETSSYLRQVYHGLLQRFLVSPEQGGANLVHFINGRPGIDWESGGFYNDRRRPGRTSSRAGDPEVVRRHWQISADLLGLGR
ncbi:SDR family oxidoreductase [Garicola koreensis]|uniref:SDR family NAD(P)-dependent oxidoreductase n=1 Tax=Garicola koreensis TaxID=1262554 RepID=UPI0031E95041